MRASAPAAAETTPPASSTRSRVAAPGAALARWYGPEQVVRGAVSYARNCAVCHGAQAEATPAWRQRDADGKLPPPPLNGTAHAWHHPISVLGAQIKFGTPGGQGSMPGFAEVLSDEQVLEIIAWFQDKWPDEIYAAWVDIEKRSRESKSQ